MFDSVQDDERVDVECLLVRTSNIMDHIAHSPALRDRWNALPVKSDRVFKRQLRQAGVIVAENKERVINSRRVSNLVAVDLDALCPLRAVGGLEVKRRQCEGPIKRMRPSGRASRRATYAATGIYIAVQPIADLCLRHGQIVGALQVHPELRRGAGNTRPSRSSVQHVATPSGSSIRRTAARGHVRRAKPRSPQEALCNGSTSRSISSCFRRAAFSS